ncbi:MAG: AMP-binding protein, partial [Clostridia bacterium]|nr:AMP-binding protein [Clostridia bacterium]
MAVENTKLHEVAGRIREMRDICGLTEAEMAEKTEVTLEAYRLYEEGRLDFPFTFIHKCALAFNIGITDLLEGHSAHLKSYTVTRRGKGQETAKEEGISIENLAPLFRGKIAEPYFVRYEYNEELQNKPIHTTRHSGQEFDYVMSGRLKVQIGDNIEYLEPGDSIYYNSSSPHGMIAVDGEDCHFVAVVLPGENEAETVVRDTFLPSHGSASVRRMFSDDFISFEDNENGHLEKISFQNEDKFNFGFDVVDAIAKREPDKLAMVHISEDKTERKFTFNDIKRASNQCANYFKSLGIRKGDRVMLILRRHYQFWFSIIALHKLGAIAIPATDQLQAHDLEYRFNAAGVSAVVCTSDGHVANQIEEVLDVCPTLKTKI